MNNNFVRSIIAIFCIVSFCNNVQAQLIQKLLNDQKLSAIKLVVLEEEKISPGSILDFGFAATTKKGKEIVAFNLPGVEYGFTNDFILESEDAELYIDDNGHAFIRIKRINELKGNTVNLKIIFKCKSDEPIIIEKSLAINYEGEAIALFKGRKGSMKNVAPPKDSLDLSGSGEDGKNLDAYVTAEIINNIPFLKMTVRNNSDSTSYFYLVKANGGKITINAEGGDGAAGRNGLDIESDNYPERGGNGKPGGKGGVIVIHIDSSAKPFEKSIRCKVDGGKGGKGGKGGTALLKYTMQRFSTPEGTDGKAGKAGKKVIIYEPVSLKW